MDTTVSSVAPALDVQRARQDFPALHIKAHDRPLVYLDNAATTQKPRSVIDRIARYYERENSNVHRGVHYLSQVATEAYERTRRTVATYINARDTREVIFTRGTTDSINVIAASYGSRLRPGDRVLVSAMEHHSNIVPWQLLCERNGCVLDVVPVSAEGEIILDEFERLLTAKTKLLAVCHTSNALGTINPVRRMIRDAHALGVPVLVDGAQALPHGPVDVQDLDCDFLCFSSHKMFGPTGVGVLYGKADILETLPPYQGGGDMIERVSFVEGTTYNELPHRFEAGTPNIAGVVGLEAAVEYLRYIRPQSIAVYESELLEYATKTLSKIDHLRIVGTAARKSPVISFLVGDVHPYDAGTILDRLGIAVRTGHHCTQPLMEHFGIPGTVRASFAFYNTFEEVDMLAEGIGRVKTMLMR